MLEHSPGKSHRAAACHLYPFSGIHFKRRNRIRLHSISTSTWETSRPSQQHWDLLSAVKVSRSSLILSTSASSLGQLWWFARIFFTRNRVASSMFMLSCNAETGNRINSQTYFLEESIPNITGDEESSSERPLSGHQLPASSPTPEHAKRSMLLSNMPMEPSPFARDQSPFVMFLL